MFIKSIKKTNTSLSTTTTTKQEDISIFTNDLKLMVE